MVTAQSKWVLIQSLFPDIAKLGLLYHTQDTNSLLEEQLIKSSAPDKIEVISLGITEAKVLSLLPELLPTELDALFLPIGRQLEDNYATINYYCELAKLPVIASHKPNVTAGALCALVADHFKLGYAYAKSAASILSGTPASSIPIGLLAAPDLILNTNAAQKLGIMLPATLTAEAKELY